MATLRFDLVATVPEFEGFADRLGYMPQVFDLQGNATPNPETKEDFIRRIMKEAVAERFYTPYVTDIQNEVRSQRDADMEAMRQNIRDRITVTFF